MGIAKQEGSSSFLNGEYNELDQHIVVDSYVLKLRCSLPPASYRMSDVDDFSKEEIETVDQYKSGQLQFEKFSNADDAINWLKS